MRRRRPISVGQLVVVREGSIDPQTVRREFGEAFVDYYVMMKRAENARYEAALAENPTPEGQGVSEWEMREYFEVY